MKNKWKILGLIFIILLCALLFAGGLFLWGDWLGYSTLGQKVAIWVQGMLLLFALLLTPIIITNSRRIWAKDKAVNESLYPSERKKALKPVPFAEFVEIKKHGVLHQGLFWRRKTRKCLVLGKPSDTEQLLPNLTTERWQLSDKTLMIYGGDVLEDVKTDWLKALKKQLGRIIGLRRKPLDAIIWLLPDNYLELNRTGLARLEKALLHMQARNQALSWQAPIYLVNTQTCQWSQAGRIEQSVGTLLPQLNINNITTIDALLENLASKCCEKGMQQVTVDNRYAFLLQLSQNIVKQDKTRIKQWLAKWLSLPKVNAPRGLFFAPLTPHDEESRDIVYLPEHYLTMTPTWQTISQDAAKQRGRRMGVAWETLLCSVVLLLTGIMGLGIITSYTQNRQLIDQSSHLVAQLDEASSQSYAKQLQAQYALQLQMDQLIYRQQQGTPIRYRFGLNHNNSLLDALWPHYLTANDHNIAQPFLAWQTANLTRLTTMSPSDPNRVKAINTSYDVLKSYLMLGTPEKTDGLYLRDFATRTWQAPNTIEVSEWQKLMPELVMFWGNAIHQRPEIAVQSSKQLIKDVRQILINQIGVQNAENTIYQAILLRASQNYANLTLAALLGDIDGRMLFTSNDELSGIFTRKAWEDFIKKEIASAAKSRQEQIDWVLSDGAQVMTSSISPDVLREHLTERYFNDYGAAWLQFLNNIQWRQADNVADVIEQLTLMSDVRQSPMIALMNVVKYQAEVAYTGGGLSDNLIRSAQELIRDKNPANLTTNNEASGPLTPTFGPVLNLVNVDNSNGLSLQTYLLRVTQVRLKLQNITSSTNPQAMAKQLAKSVFQGTSVDLTETRDYGNLIAANLGEEWSGFGYNLFKLPLEQAWQVILTPAASSFNDTWQTQIVYEWEKAFAGRYPFKKSDNDASLAELARFLRPDAGVIDKFIASELGGILEKQGDKWVINNVNAQGLNFSAGFIDMLNLFNDLSGPLLSSGDAQMAFDLMARSGGNVMRSELIIDKQKLDYYNQMPVWQRFTWPGDGYSPYAQLSFSTNDAGLRLYQHFSGDWAWIRLLESASIKQIDSSRYEVVWRVAGNNKLKYILRSQSGQGPLALLKLRNYTLPKQVFDFRKREEPTDQIFTLISDLDSMGKLY